MITCAVCSQTVTSRRGLAFHIKKHEINSIQQYLEMFPNEESNVDPKNDSLLICPICGQKNLKQLTHHITWKHDMTREQFENLYPDQKLFIDEISTRCSKACKRGNEIRIENMKKFPDKYKEIYKNAARRRKENNPDIGLKISKILREQGVYDNTSSRTKSMWEDPSYRDMQSEKCKKQHENGLTSIVIQNSGKKRYAVTIGGIEYHMRSTWEVKFAEILYSKSIKFEYEPFSIKYEFNSTIKDYYPDFVIPGKNIIFEVKPINLTKTAMNIAKQNKCIESGFDFRYITEIELNDIANINFDGCF